MIDDDQHALIETDPELQKLIGPGGRQSEFAKITEFEQQDGEVNVAKWLMWVP